MKIQATAKQVRISPRKVRLITDVVRKMSLEETLLHLPLMRKRAASVLGDVMQSAVANAVNNAKLPRNELRIAEIIVNEGQALKRFHASTRGRVHPYKKRSTNITVVLEQANKAEQKQIKLSQNKRKSKV